MRCVLLLSLDRWNQRRILDLNLIIVYREELLVMIMAATSWWRELMINWVRLIRLSVIAMFIYIIVLFFMRVLIIVIIWFWRFCLRNDRYLTVCVEILMYRRFWIGGAFLVFYQYTLSGLHLYKEPRILLLNDLVFRLSFHSVTLYQLGWSTIL